MRGPTTSQRCTQACTEGRRATVSRSVFVLSTQAMLLHGLQQVASVLLQPTHHWDGALDAKGRMRDRVLLQHVSFVLERARLAADALHFWVGRSKSLIGCDVGGETSLRDVVVASLCVAARLIVLACVLSGLARGSCTELSGCGFHPCGREGEGEGCWWLSAVRSVAARRARPGRAPWAGWRGRGRGRGREGAPTLRRTSDFSCEGEGEGEGAQQGGEREGACSKVRLAKNEGKGEGEGEGEGVQVGPWHATPPSCLPFFVPLEILPSLRSSPS